MKVSLVVASGTHQGKVVPIPGPQFLIGREAQCQLRPASQAISKKHCGIITRDGKVFVVDYGSTNGTLVNDVLLKGEEVEVEDGASMLVGPLDFTIRVERAPALSDGTPFPANTPDALAAVKAVSSTAPASPTRDSTPSPARPAAKPAVGSDSKASGPGLGSKEAAALKAAPKPAPKPASPKISAPSSDEESSDDIAAMLLGMDDGEEVPGGSTVMEMPAALAPETQTGANAGKGDDKNAKKSTSREDMTNAANDILRKMRRRPT